MRLSLIVLSLLLLAACGDEEPSKSACDEVSLEADIMPIVQANCAITQCHADARSPLLTSKAAVIENADQIAFRVGNGSMPPASFGTLTASEKSKIECWVENGAEDN